MESIEKIDKNIEILPLLNNLKIIYHHENGVDLFNLVSFLNQISDKDYVSLKDHLNEILKENRNSIKIMETTFYDKITKIKINSIFYLTVSAESFKIERCYFSEKDDGRTFKNKKLEKLNNHIEAIKYIFSEINPLNLNEAFKRRFFLDEY